MRANGKIIEEKFGTNKERQAEDGNVINGARR
jgi:hypothetical protein